MSCLMMNKVHMQKIKDDGPSADLQAIDVLFLIRINLQAINVLSLIQINCRSCEWLQYNPR